MLFRSVSQSRYKVNKNKYPYKAAASCGYFTDCNQLGLVVKTYQSDVFNNWLSTEWIDGTNGINEITAIDTSTGKFTIDALNLSKKLYDVLNRIAVSGGSYEDWQEAVYGEEPFRKAENPIYVGGMSSEIVNIVTGKQIGRAHV